MLCIQVLNIILGVYIVWVFVQIDSAKIAVLMNFHVITQFI